MTFNDFEILTKQLLTERLKKEFGYEIPVDHQRAFSSLNGNTYKIDISYKFSLFETDYLTLIECKCWNSYVTREKINSFKAILEDLKAHKGIVVTTKGFQKGAVKYARSQNIGLIKITNDHSFENYSHYDGGIATTEEILVRKDNFEMSVDYTSVGLFYPRSNIIDFMKIHYGKELASFLQNEFTTDILDESNPNLNPVVEEQLIKLPDNWSDNYVRYETGGLFYNLQNENELRTLSMILQLLKPRQKRNNKLMKEINHVDERLKNIEKQIKTTLKKNRKL